MKKGNLQAIASVLLLVAALMYFGYIPTRGTPSMPPTTTTTLPTTTLPAGMGYVDTVGIDIVTADQYHPTSTKDVCGVYWVNGVRKTDIATTGSNDISASPGDVVKICAGLDETTNGDPTCDVNPGENGTADWFFNCKEFVVENKPTMEVGMYLTKEGSSPSVTVYTEDGTDVTSTTGANQSFVAGSNYVLPMKIKAVADACQGQPIDPAMTGLDYSNVMCCQWNKTQFDDVELRVQDTSTELPVVSAPQEFAVGSTNTSKCWGITTNICDSATSWADLYVDVDDTYEPDAQATGVLGCTVYDVSMYIDADIQGPDAVKFGIEDEDQNDVGVVNDPSFSIYGH